MSDAISTKNAMKERFQTWWSGLSSKGRMGVLTGSTVLACGVVFMMIGSDREATKAEDTASTSQTRIVNNNDVLEETITETVGAQLADNLARQDSLEDGLGNVEETQGTMLEAMEGLSQRFDAFIEEGGTGSSEEAARAAARAEIDAALAAAEKAGDEGEPSRSPVSLAGGSYPPAPPMQGRVRPAPVSLTDAGPIDIQVLGGITSMPAGLIDLPEKNEPGASGVYLAPGFMNAILLTGVDTLASGNGTANPEPILLRVQAPAILPNYVRANLQGCFVIGNATGSLAKERVEVQAVSLTCIDYDKQAVIDEPIKGFLVDTDGKKGLSGKVVTKAGAIVGRAFVAGLVEGIGEGVESSAGAVAVSPLGGVQTLDSGDIAQAGLGSGVAEGARTLSEYYLELAEQLGPVIEVGAAKEVVLVIQEGTTLNIRRDVNVVQ